MTRATVSTKGWVVIPKDLRKKYGLKAGQAVEVVDYGGILGIVPVPADPVEALTGMFATEGGGSWTADLLDERRREREGEAARVAD